MHPPFAHSNRARSPALQRRSGHLIVSHVEEDEEMGAWRRQALYPIRLFISLAFCLVASALVPLSAPHYPQFFKSFCINEPFSFY